MISVILNGGLGNQMFQFATAKALALKLNTELVLDLSFFNQHSNKSWCRPYELHVFNHSATIRQKKINFNKALVYILPYIRKNHIGKKIFSKFKFYFDDYNYYKNLKNGTTIFGYFANENFFKEYRNEILSEFTFKHPMDEKCCRISQTIKNCNAVSVHIRRGDYLNNSNSKIFVNCSLDWYKSAIQYIKDRADSPEFYFFSDDMEWVKENFNSMENSHFVDINEGLTAYNDMRLMSLCKHNIVANSTFSWWGAWMNTNTDKMVIAPKNYYQDEKKNSEKPNIMPESWILLK